MARSASITSLVLVLVTAMWAQSLAQPNCTPAAIVGLAPCIGFITGSSSNPPSTCCTQLAAFVQSQAQCLCAVLKGAPVLPLVVNQTQALTLPGACKIQVPPLSQCNAVVPQPATPAAGSPQGAPAPSSPSTPSDATARSPASPSILSGPTGTSPAAPPVLPGTPSTGSGSKTVPTRGQSSSARSSAMFTPSLFFFFFVFAASVLSSF